ncbi:MAG: hypothetical protein CO189_07275 [candidate division Zixibacteria bacterium CG_4_9_14_3_um_filter_46_8]|nr:MAG: hypothetical protein CO189_07275 [candidate division Zixibacteria bacterium CG_4_9_14_3_um_filter_46_8]
MKRTAIGIDIGGTAIKFGVISDAGKVLHHFSRITEASPASISGIIQEGVKAILDSNKQRNWRIEHIGIASPGAVDIDSGIIFGASPNIPGWSGTNLKRIVGIFGYPSYADNDANAACLGEMKVGAGKGFRQILFVTIGTGVGGGIVINGNIYRGANFGAAEIGHAIIRPGGRRCGCGNRGCMEKYASVTGMIATAKQILSRRRKGKLWRAIRANLANLTPEIITAEFRNGDPVAIEIIESQAEALSQGVAGALNLLNPEVLIIGGAISEAGTGYIKAISNAIIGKTFPAATEKLKIIPARLGGRAGMVGAAYLGWILPAN